MWKGLRNSFFAGLLVVLPVAASIGILWWLFTTITNFLLPVAWRSELWSPLYRVAALLAFAAVTTAAGWITRLVVGRRLVTLGEGLIERVPLFNKTYKFVKEISHTLLTGQKTMFQRVVLVEFPRPGTWAVGFVTSESSGEPQARTRAQVINVFVPTTPNPTSGFLILVPREQVIAMDMTVAEGMKMVISAGSVVPPYLPSAAGAADGNGAR